ncbi:OLC1v1006802C1 [Oldenlandia corymbosa var. corymbosa]|uniref:OLC1v1006802C1 n=1 Tax=Oldenlandia corymbosa var. corymbosa TaxID=529605 RepID=A0AAV1DK92_OLDCO|nr:OLC1v1006802C1 [Oldenlandia corymbosa var. corymbosa]
MNRHARLIKLGLQTNPCYASKLIAEYAFFPTSHSLNHAHRIFKEVPSDLRDTALWASLISAYSRSEQPNNALHLFSHLLGQPQASRNAEPNAYVFTSVARAIASAPEHLPFGQSVHGMIIKRGYTPRDVFVETALVDMYVKCGMMECALKLFDEMPYRNSVSWNVMIFGYIQNAEESKGFGLFLKMRYLEFCAPDQFTVATLLSGCAGVQDLAWGMQLHAVAIVSGFEINCGDAIATMYFNCGLVCSGEKILEGRRSDDSVAKLIKIRGFISNLRYQDALNCISSARNSFLILCRDHTVIVPILAACAKLSLLKVGKQLHGLLITSLQSLLETSPSEDGDIIGCALIDMYSKCGVVGDARKVFDDVLPRSVSHGNSMISCYVCNGLLEDARNLLEKMPEKNVVSWTTMMTGYVRSGKPRECLNMMAKMYCSKVDGNCVTFAVGLEACSDLPDLELGKLLHAKIVRTLINADATNVVIGTSLVDMYCKSGKLNYAQTVFDLMEDKNIVAWTSVIMGYAVHGFGSRSLELFQELIETGTKPNEVTFIAVLTACSHCGLVDEGLEYFRMIKKYGLIPNEDHQTCLIDMLGRSGRLEDAFHMLEEHEDTETNGESCCPAAWGALLGACHLHGNVKLSERVAEKMLVHTDQMSTTHIALSNVYAAAGLWNEAYKIRENWRRGALKGDPGLSSISMHLSNP